MNDEQDSERSFSILLLKLNQLIDKGFGDEQEAENVRDLMDVQWGRMSPEQQQRVRWLSVDLDRLSGEDDFTPSISHEDHERWREELRAVWNDMRDARRDGALALLRDSRASSEQPDGVIFLQGRAWEAAGFPEAAVKFFEAAERFCPVLN
jgi:hypothetical protein